MGRNRRGRRRGNGFRSFCYDNQRFNRKIVIIRKALNEVIHILNPSNKC